MSLQIDDVKKCKSKADLRKQLTSLPKGLNGAYARIFERSESPKVLTTLIHWLVFAESPMTVEQLAHVVAVDYSDDDGPSYHPDEVYEDAAEVFTVCYRLVTEIEGATVRYPIASHMLTIKQGQCSWRISQSRNISSNM